MDACEAVEKELQRVITKFNGVHEHAKRMLGDVTKNFEDLKSSIAEVPADEKLTTEQMILLRDTISKTREKLQRLTTDHRDLHGAVSKIGKTIDRNFVSDFSPTTRNDVLVEEQNIQLLNKVIAQHLQRNNLDDVAATLIHESKLPAEEVVSDPFSKLHRIWEAIYNGDLKEALEWASEHSAKLETRNSSLEFKLHRIAFLQKLDAENGGGSPIEAIAYARKHFSKFVDKFEKEIQLLMGTLMYIPVGLENSPYRGLCGPNLMVEAADTFLKDACGILGITKDSPLTVVTNTGCTALPALLSLKQVMMTRQVFGIWNGRDELPIEIDLDAEHRYHSIFACPILRQQSSEDNPPMKLVCGHVISRDALDKLCNGPTLKCPYCPVDQSPNDAKLIYF